MAPPKAQRSRNGPAGLDRHSEGLSSCGVHLARTERLRHDVLEAEAYLANVEAQIDISDADIDLLFAEMYDILGINGDDMDNARQVLRVLIHGIEVDPRKRNRGADRLQVSAPQQGFSPHAPKGIRTPVLALKGPCPSPLDDGGGTAVDCTVSRAGVNLGSRLRSPSTPVESGPDGPVKVSCWSIPFLLHWRHLPPGIEGLEHGLRLMAGQHILVVDDDRDTLVLVRMVLEGQGYRVTQAESGAEAVELARVNVPDLIILDVMMPRADGYDVARWLRDEPATAHVPILMFSAKGRLEDKAEGYEAGVDDYLTKPVHPARMLARVKATLERTGGGPVGPDAPRGMVLACLGALPGVGASTIATGLSLALGEAGGVVILVEEVSPGAATPSETEVGPQIRQWLNRLGASLTQEAGGLWRLAAPGLTREEGLPLVEGVARLGDMVVLDLGAAYERIARWLPNVVDQVVLVVGPTRPSLLAADDIVRSLREADMPAARIGAVIVYHDPAGGAVDVGAVRRGLGVDVLGVIPAAPDALQAAEAAGVPLLLHAPDSPAAQPLRFIARDLRAQLGLE